MPAVINAAGLIWNKGFLFGTIAGGLADSVPFGELQEFHLKDTIGLKEVMGPSSLIALGVGVTDAKVSGTAKWLKVRARQLVLARGGSATFSSVTTYTRGINDEPAIFNAHYKTPSDGSDLELKCYGCIAPDLTLPMGMRDFIMPDFNFNIYGDQGTGKIYEYIVAGDQTTS